MVIKKEMVLKMINFYKIYSDLISLVDDNNRTLAFNRTFESKEIVISFNKSDKKQMLQTSTQNYSVHRQFSDTESGFR